MTPVPPTNRLLLVGAGHAHAQVLLDWVHRPVPGTELLVVSPTALAPYSGMVPGWLGGTYRFDDICIDFAALAAAAGARLLLDELSALDADRRRITLASGGTLGYDLLSLNIGSTLQPPAVSATGAAPVLSLRPLGRLHEAWSSWLDRYPGQADRQPFRLAAVGGGAAGFEALLAVRARLLALQPGRPVLARLISRGDRLLPGLAPGAVRSAHAALQRAGVTLQLGTAWHDDIARQHDLVLWATGAQAHGWQRDAQRRGSLAVSAQGFVQVDRQLRSVSHPQVFAVGDCAEWTPPLPKSGVHAVRMGAVLSHNLRAALAARGAGAAAAADDDGRLAAYQPQRHALVLLATADGRAIASRGRWSAEGRWMWRWKDHIDHQFLRRFMLPVPAAAGPIR